MTTYLPDSALRARELAALIVWFVLSFLSGVVIGLGSGWWYLAAVWLFIVGQLAWNHSGVVRRERLTRRGTERCHWCHAERELSPLEDRETA